MEIKMSKYPTEEDWFEVKRRAAFTAGIKAKYPPSQKWKEDILKARHSPIRFLFFSFELTDIPYFVSVHLVRHVHSQFYVRSQRNDRQNKYDRNAARQDAPVDMIWDVTGEELLQVANKRLCMQASEETREVVRKCCDLVIEKFPEFKDVLVPMCVYHGGVCHEMFPCGGNK